MSNDPKVTEDVPRAAVVTGAAHGIGLAVAEKFLDGGLRVVAVDKDGSELRRVLGGTHAELVEHDLAVQAGELAAKVLTLVGHCPVIINNVGVMDGRSFLDLPSEALDLTWRTNVAGPWEFTRILTKDLIATGLGGSVVFNLSLHADRVRMCPDYSASKAALRMLVAELASELGPYGIRVNAVSPGVIDTWSDRVPDAPGHRAESERLVALGRLGTATDVASAVAFLCDEQEARYITGADLKVDGGLDQFNWLHHLYGTAEAERERTERKD
jgi:Dehydrogenases with different specificities (related to short-chain alcohol dehydrogenases)